MATTVGFFNPKNGFQAQITDRMEAEAARQMAQQLAMAQLANQLMLEKGRSADASARNASNERIADIQAKGVVEASKARAAIESDSMKRTRLQNARMDSEARRWVDTANASIEAALQKYKETGVETDGTSIPQSIWRKLPWVGKRKPSAEEVADYADRLRQRYTSAATALMRSGKVTVDDKGLFLFTGSADEADLFDGTPVDSGGGSVPGVKPGAPAKSAEPPAASGGKVSVELIPTDPSRPGWWLRINGEDVKVSRDVWNDHAEAAGLPGDRPKSKGGGKDGAAVIQNPKQGAAADVPLLLSLIPKDVTADVARGLSGVIKQSMLGDGNPDTSPKGLVDASKLVGAVRSATDVVDASKLVDATKALAGILGAPNQPPAAPSAQLSGPMAGVLDAIRRIHAASNSISR